MSNVVIDTQAWLKKECPICVFYGPSGTGKTTLLSTLFDDSIYHPALFVDIDGGGKTVAKWTKNADACDYRTKAMRSRGSSVFDWLGATLMEAETSAHGAILIEGITKFRDDMAGRWKIQNASKLKTPRGNMWAYQEASSYTSALFSQLRHVQDVRQMSGTGVPIIVTLNAGTSRHESDGDTVTFITPKLSDNLCEDLMSGADLFAELTRRGGRSPRLLTRRGKLNPWRKARNPIVASHIANLADPKIDLIFDKWVEVETNQIQELADELDADEDTIKTDDTQPDKTSE